MQEDKAFRELEATKQQLDSCNDCIEKQSAALHEKISLLNQQLLAERGQFLHQLAQLPQNARRYETDMRATSILLWLRKYLSVKWPHAPRPLLHALHGGFDYQAGYNIRKQEQEAIEKSNRQSAPKSQCGSSSVNASMAGRSSASVYGEMLAEGVMMLSAVLQLRPTDVFYDLGSGVGKFSTQIALQTHVSMVRGIELSHTRFSLAQEIRSALLNNSFPKQKAASSVPQSAPGTSHCRHGYCVCIPNPSKSSGKASANDAEEDLEAYEQDIEDVKGELRESVKESVQARPDPDLLSRLEQGNRLQFEEGDIGAYRENGYPHITHAYTCSTLYSDNLLKRMVANLVRSPRIRTFSSLKRLSLEIETRNLYAFYLWKVIMVPVTWVAETEVFIYRFR